jgi:hypothetical protein
MHEKCYVKGQVRVLTEAVCNEDVWGSGSTVSLILKLGNRIFPCGIFQFYLIYFSKYGVTLRAE